MKSGKLTLLEPEHGGPLDGRVPLLHEAGELLEEVELLLGVLLTEDGEEVLDLGRRQNLECIS